jgi:hypothetical protein
MAVAATRFRIDLRLIAERLLILILIRPLAFSDQLSAPTAPEARLV